MLERIYRADLQAGGESFWFDRMLERQAVASDGNALFTRGRALYMYTHNPNVLGFAGQGTQANIGGGGVAYREAIQIGNNNCRPGPGAPCNLYSVTVSGATLTEVTAERRQYPSYWSSVHSDGAVTVHQRKFITHNNVAVTVLDITNLSAQPTTRTITATTPSWVTQSASADGTERVGTFSTHYNLTTISRSRAPSTSGIAAMNHCRHGTPSSPSTTGGGSTTCPSSTLPTTTSRRCRSIARS